MATITKMRAWRWGRGKKNIEENSRFSVRARKRQQKGGEQRNNPATKDLLRRFWKVMPVKASAALIPKERECGRRTDEKESREENPHIFFCSFQSLSFLSFPPPSSSSSSPHSFFLFLVFFLFLFFFFFISLHGQAPCQDGRSWKRAGRECPCIALAVSWAPSQICSPSPWAEQTPSLPLAQEQRPQQPQQHPNIGAKKSAVVLSKGEGKDNNKKENTFREGRKDVLHSPPPFVCYETRGAQLGCFHRLFR